MRVAMSRTAVIALLVAAAPSAFADGNTISVRVAGLRSAKGSVFCQLFAKGDGFPKSGFQAQTSAPIADGAAVCRFSGVAPGGYAVSAFHDENGDGKLDKNFLGIPKEGVGASNNRRHAMGPPKWDESKFAVSADTAIEIKLRY